MSLSQGVYWCARDLSSFPIGNHHFVLLVAEPSDFRYMGLNAHNEDGTYFYTFGAASDYNSGFRLITAYNDADDVRSVREFIDPDEHTAWYKADFDLEPNHVSSDINHIRRVALHAVYYQRWQDKDVSKLPDYRLVTDNCASWVNSLLKSIGISKSVRKKYGDNAGFDFGQGVEIDSKLFTNPN